MKKNNFNIVRFLGAAFVFAGHMGILMGGAAPLMGSFPLHEIGVAVLFTISGYLITKSWLSDPHPIRFAVRRFFRLWPPFAVLILLMVFVAGPLLSDLGTTVYFESDYTSYLRNLRFFTAYSLPGVFTTLPAANSVNGSLWTMPVEAFLYIVTPLLLSLIRAKRDVCNHGNCCRSRFVFACILRRRSGSGIWNGRNCRVPSDYFLCCGNAFYI